MGLPGGDAADRAPRWPRLIDGDDGRSSSSSPWTLSCSSARRNFSFRLARAASRSTSDCDDIAVIRELGLSDVIVGTDETLETLETPGALGNVVKDALRALFSTCSLRISAFASASFSSSSSTLSTYAFCCCW